MFNTFNIEKKMFEGQFHERDQFSLNVEGNHYKGIYHNGDISWFHPHPLNDLKERIFNQYGRRSSQKNAGLHFLLKILI